ncbi:MAG TPA: hypothetical protein VE174_00480 [Actinomycetota bacterium]|nr:hypothetical protein [Actinomycetota bacterium]
MKKYFSRLPVLAIGFLILGMVAAPLASAKRGEGKSAGTIASFDGTTLTVTMKDASTVTATVTEATKIKVSHRGRHEHGKGFKKHSNGALADLVAGNLVIKMKMAEGVLEKIRIKRAAAPESLPDSLPDSCDDEDEVAYSLTSDEDDEEEAIEDEDDEDSADDSSADDSLDDSVNDSLDGEDASKDC